jgi:hypothetical protein
MFTAQAKKHAINLVKNHQKTHKACSDFWLLKDVQSGFQASPALGSLL